MANSSAVAFSPAEAWESFWYSPVGDWILTKGLLITLLVLGALLVSRFIAWLTEKMIRRFEYEGADALVRSETSKHRHAVASVVSWVLIVLVFVVVVIQITNVLNVPVGSLVAPAAVLGAALGFGAQKLVEDLLSGFFIITERQYGFGDLVQLSVLGAPDDAQGTVEEVTLRVTKLRTTEGEVFTFPNGNIVRSVNLSKDWARAVVDIPVPLSADLNRVNEILSEVCSSSVDDYQLKNLLLNEPSLMGVESIGMENLNLRLVARTLPGKQFDVGRRLRVLVVRALGRAGVVAPTESVPSVGSLPRTAADVPEDDLGAESGR